jgi:hypothetical protein
MWTGQMLGKLERFLEHAVEGGLRRVLPTTLQPVQLAKAAARAMEQGQVVGPRGPVVPNSYRISLAPADLNRFIAYRQALCRELSQYLDEYAQERDLRRIDQTRVELVEDPGQRAGSVRAEARFLDLPAEQATEIEAAIEGTRRLRLADLAAAQASLTPEARTDGLTFTDGRSVTVELDPRLGVLRLGRATDNDIVVADQRVSRYHAQLRWLDGGWLLYDLDSTNGTYVDERQLEANHPRLIGPGMVVRLGDHDFSVRPSTAV